MTSIAQFQNLAGPQTSGRSLACRFCSTPLHHRFVDLGMSPLCESYVSGNQVDQMERFYPLQAFVCGECFLVQLPAYVSAEHIFSDYAYFSSYSESWVEHARRYVEKMTTQFNIGLSHQVVELASNDGYLLQYFVAKGVRALGVEPAANVAEAAIRQGVPTMVRFFGENTAREMAANGHSADLLVANNVLAQVPDLNDFIKGMQIVLAPNGVITVEFPHLLRTIEGNQFDQVYHEHFSYFSLFTTVRLFAAHGLTVFDVEELPTHGGSLRVYARHRANTCRSIDKHVDQLLAAEKDAGLNRLDRYSTFAKQVEETKRELLSFLIAIKREGKSIAGYGAPGKGNTLLNYCGIRTDFLEYTVDRSPHKQGLYLPGTHVPIYAPDKIRETRPDFVLILPWNLKDEIMRQMAYIRDWGGQFIVPIPKVELCK